MNLRNLHLGLSDFLYMIYDMKIEENEGKHIHETSAVEAQQHKHKPNKPWPSNAQWNISMYMLDLSVIFPFLYLKFRIVTLINKIFLED